MTTPANFSIRPFEPADHPAVAILLKQCPFPSDTLHLGSCNTLVAAADRELIGIVNLSRNDDAALLHLLYVGEDYRGQGIGSRLLRDMLAQAHEQFIKDVFLSCGQGEVFFEHRGFLRVPHDVIPRTLRVLSPAGSSVGNTALKITLINRPLYC